MIDSPLSNQQKWRLILGEDENSDNKVSISEPQGKFPGEWAMMDKLLSRLYGGRLGSGNKKSIPTIHRWLGDIRTYFNTDTVILLQKDAIHRYNLDWILFEPEILEDLEPSVELVATLLSLQKTLPEETRETARIVIRKIVDRITIQKSHYLRRAIRAALSRQYKEGKARFQDIDWRRTIYYNLRHYQPENNTIVPEKIFSRLRKEKITKELFICVDQSASMSSSVVYSGIYACVLAQIPSLRTQLYLFDTQVYDVSDQLDNPVDLLFGINLGGGTHITRALKHAENHIRKKRDAMVLLISDLEENSSEGNLIEQVNRLKQDGVTVLVLLSLSDDGTPRYNTGLAQEIHNMDIPVFSATPDSFPEIISKYL